MSGDAATPTNADRKEAVKTSSDSLRQIFSWRFDEKYLDLEDGCLLYENGAYYLPVIISDELPVFTFDDILTILPESIIAEIGISDGREKKVSVSWNCPEYTADQEGQWPTEGEYIFAGELPEKYILADNADELDIIVSFTETVYASDGIVIDAESKQVFANGAEIVIKNNNGITSIYNKNDELLSETTDVTGYVIYGGWNGGTHNASTSVTVESGTLGNVWGGGVNDTINGNTAVVINGGTVAYVLGGCSGGTVTNNTSVTINGGKVRHVAGGGEGAAVRGTCNVAINSGAKVWGDEYTSTSDSRTGNGGCIYAGGIGGGTVNKTKLNLDGGDYGWAYGAGSECEILAESRTVVNTMPQIGNVISAGGYDCEIPLAILELDSTKLSSSQMMAWLFGSGEQDEIEQVKIVIKNNVALPQGMPIYANWADMPDAASWNYSKVEEAKIEIDYNKMPSNQNTNIPEIVGLSEGDTTLTINGITTAEKYLNVYMQDIDNLILNQSLVVPFGYNKNSLIGNAREDLKIETLKISSDSTVKFGANKTVTIDELSGNGKIVFDGSNSPTISVGKVLSTAEAPLYIKTSGSGWNESVYNTYRFFDGKGVENLSSVSCLKSQVPNYTAVKSEDGKAIILKRTEDLSKKPFFSTATFDKESYCYGENMELKIALEDEAGNAVSGMVTITAGAHGTAIASASLDSAGKASLKIPVNTFFRDLNDDERYLIVNFDGNEKYSSSSARLTCKDHANIYKIQVDKATIKFEDAIKSPKLNTNPQQKIDIPEDAFYTADVLWNPDVKAFTAGTSYTASIKITPKSGFDLESVEKVLYNTKEKTKAWQGSSLIFEAITFDPIPEDNSVYRANTETISTVPEELEERFNTLEELNEVLLLAAKKELKELYDDNAIYIELTLMVSLDGGRTWEEAVEGNFPEDGIDVYLPYPEGTNKDHYKFTVVHMLTKSMGNHQAGDVEIITPELTERGLKCHFSSLSPVAVAWKLTSGNSSPSEDRNSGNTDHNKNLYYDQKKGWIDQKLGIVSDSKNSGRKQSQWIKNDQGWWFCYVDGTWPQGTLDKNGNIDYTWEFINGKWWAFDSQGYAAEGWIFDISDGHWYYIDINSGMKTGWHLDSQDGRWYYLNPSNGELKTGWQFISGKWYYLNEKADEPSWRYDENQKGWVYVNRKNLHPYGCMYQNEMTPDGYLVGENGSWMVTDLKK